MRVTRRQLLNAAGATTAAFALSRSGAATRADEADTDDEGNDDAGGDRDRVFVHPARTGLLGEVLDVVDDIGGSVLFEYDNFEFIAATIPPEVRDELEGDSRVARVEDDDRIGIPPAPSPPILGGGSDVCDAHRDQTPGWGFERIGAGEVAETGAGVDVAVLDTGVQTDHCDLAVADGRNVTDDGGPTDYEDRHGHGTHCAGVTCALDNGVGVVGVAPGATLHAVKVLGDDGSGYQSWMAAGIDWCLSEGIEVVSMSFGGGERTAAVDRAVRTAAERGHLLVAAAGNEGNAGGDDCAEGNVAYPATHDDVVAVSAMDEDDSIAAYSSLGEAVELLAPGSGIESTERGNRYGARSGTSMACPFVAGVAALLWERSGASGPGPNESVRETLGATAETVLDSCAEGRGLVHAAAATGAEPPEPGGSDGVVGTVFGGIRSLLGRILDAIRRLIEWLSGLF